MSFTGTPASARCARLVRLNGIINSIGLGEDGPTHQPIEHLSALRAIPNLVVLRPGDAAETAEAWRAALRHEGGPVALVLTRQKVPFIDRSGRGEASGVGRGAYVLAESEGGSPEIVLMASGSEVSIALEAQGRLMREHGIRARVVSMPSHELFLRQDEGYRRAVLPAGVKRIAIEAAHPMSWQRFVGDEGVVMGIERFGASAPYQRIYQEFGLTPEQMVATALRLLER